MRLTGGSFALAVVLALGVGCGSRVEREARAAEEPVADTPCGQPQQPRCPLQQWMHTHLKPVMAGGDVRELAPHLGALATMAPAELGDWSAIATRASAAAARGDVDEVRSHCASCHNAYRSRYRSEHRRAPLPTVMLAGR